jgi:hypothetical protein
VRKVEPDEVAAGIVEALQTGRVDVWVPRSVVALVRSAAFVPRSVADTVTRALKGDRVLVDPDHVERAAYEQRTSDDGSPGPVASGAQPAELEHEETSVTEAKQVHAV